MIPPLALHDPGGVPGWTARPARAILPSEQSWNIQESLADWTLDHGRQEHHRVD
jgi:hypothetical protein